VLLLTVETVACFTPVITGAAYPRWVATGSARPVACDLRKPGMKAKKIVTAWAAALAACAAMGMAPPAAQASSVLAATWTKQAPAVHPPALVDAAMAYDAATGTAVLFGGQTHKSLIGETWTWNGTTWTQQAPAVHPPALVGAAMAYDAATGTVVLFGGQHVNIFFAGTWTWG
jgi:hypothetical protein